ncbi:MAG: hypothetical protein RIT14_714 [Pseudomonadota bacterium]|jgi:hypothetical protein
MLSRAQASLATDGWGDITPRNAYAAHKMGVRLQEPKARFELTLLVKMMIGACLVAVNLTVISVVAPGAIEATLGAAEFTALLPRL